MLHRRFLLIFSVGLIALSSCGSGPSYSSVSVSTSQGSSSATTTSSTSTSEYADPVWKVKTSLYGNDFRAALQTLIKSSGSKTISYSQNNSVLAKSDACPGKSGYVIPFYHKPTESAQASWGSVINKEHVWPNSRGAGKSGPGADPQMLRPTLESDNTSRGNKFFGLKSEGSSVYDPAELGYAPARGECARIIFYLATKYYGTCGGETDTNHGTKPLELSNTPGDANDKHTMGKLIRLIRWNYQYPVTETEKRRNDYLDGQGFSRNPFIDNPDLVNYIWTETEIRKSRYTPGSYSWSPTVVKTEIDFEELGLRAYTLEERDDG